VNVLTTYNASDILRNEFVVVKHMDQRVPKLVQRGHTEKDKKSTQGSKRWKSSTSGANGEEIESK
jgi:hypothetical protein